MESGLFIGIDIGTSSVRSTAIDNQRCALATAKVDLPNPLNPSTGWHEQPAELWWSATRACLKQLLNETDPGKVKALAIDGTSSTVLLVDHQNVPIGNALMYNDSRAAVILDRIARFAPSNSITLSASSSLAKAIYLLRENEHLQVQHIMHQADWLMSKFSGKPALSDENNCLKLGYDSVHQAWPQWLQNAPYKLYEKLPSVYSSGTSIGTISTAIAEDFHLPNDVHIVTGTTDSTASTLATGVNDIGEAVTTYGSTLVTKIISDMPITSVSDGVYSHRLPGGKWLVGGASNSGGNVLLQHFSVEQLESLSVQIDPQQPSGLDYYPLTGKGERFPINDPSMSPRLEPRPDSDVKFLQGIFEGFASIEKMAYDKMHSLGAPRPTSIYSAGGQAVHNQALTQIRTRILGIPVLTAEHTEASYGVALIARSAMLR